MEALAKCREKVKVVFCGEPDSRVYFDGLRKRARALGVEDQVTWLGRVSEQEKLDLYANALMVIFIPYDEDYGYVTPEAMMSSKAVITLDDSGGPLEFVKNGETGIVVSDDVSALAGALDEVWASRSEAERMGENARQHISEMKLSWKTVLNGLLGQ